MKSQYTTESFSGANALLCQRSILKERIHSSYLGIVGCLRRAKECLFWPNMTGDIRDNISACYVCRTYEIANQRGTLMSHDIPDRLWGNIGTDLFSSNGKDNLVTVDYYSNFWELDYLADTGAQTIIGKLKAHCARHGIPDTIVSDNGRSTLAMLSPGSENHVTSHT